MSDTESDSEYDDDNYDDDDDNNMNNDDNNNNNVNNMNNVNNNNAPFNGVQNEKIIEFVGSINGKAGWKKCLYCDRFHPNAMHLTGMEYCGHCWGWLNSHQFDLEKGIYQGQNPISEIKNYLKETFKLHDPTKCTNVECIYNKILNLEKNKKLHIDLCIELGFAKKQEPSNTVEIINGLTNGSTNRNTDKSNYNINKKLNTRINFKLSHITI